MNASASRSGWIKWLLLALLVIAIALGVARALGKRKAQNEAATAAAVACTEAPVYELSPQDVTTVESLVLAQSVGVSGSLKALQTAAIKARVAGEVQGLASARAMRCRRAKCSPASTAPRPRPACARPNSRPERGAGAGGDRPARAGQQPVAGAAGLHLGHRAGNLDQQPRRRRGQPPGRLAALDIARKALGDTTLRSPLSGQVSARLVQNGERVGVDARLLEVVDLSASSWRRRSPRRTPPA
jgi:membrane fusion protein, multidrug efflux system